MLSVSSAVFGIRIIFIPFPCFVIPDNLDPSGSTMASQKPLPFSMSGDGVEDVAIPSVFMKKLDALFLLALSNEVGEVVVRLAPGNKDGGSHAKEEEAGKEDEKGEGNQEEDVKTKGDIDKDGGLNVKGVEEVSKHLQKLLEELDPVIMTDKLKGSVAKELYKLKVLNSGLSGADSASVVVKGGSEVGGGGVEEGGATGNSGGGGDTSTCSKGPQSSMQSHEGRGRT